MTSALKDSEAPYGWKTEDDGTVVPREKPGRKPMTAGEKRPRKRKVEEGRITTLAKPALGRCIAHLANEMGILPNTMARILIVEGLKGRGYTMEQIDKEFSDESIREQMIADGKPAESDSE